MDGEILARTALAEGGNRGKPLVTEIRVYYEGDKRLKEGFQQILRTRSLRKLDLGAFVSSLLTVAALLPPDFQIAQAKHTNAWNILLRDSEGPAPANYDNSMFFIVQVMESWFLADVDALEGYYGQGFKRTILEGNSEVEQILKKDIILQAPRSHPKDA